MSKGYLSSLVLMGVVQVIRSHGFDSRLFHSRL